MPSLKGLGPALIVTVIAAVPIEAVAVQVIYKLPDRTIRLRLLNRPDFIQIKGRGTRERIDLAFLFDRLSNCDGD